jgi:hypothetical protein
MNSLHTVGAKMRRTMGFALLVAFLSLGAIGGCGDGTGSNAEVAGPTGSDGSDGSDGGGLGGEETSEVQTAGCNASDQSKCIMVSFDDGVTPGSMQLLRPLLLDGLQVDAGGKQVCTNTLECEITLLTPAQDPQGAVQFKKNTEDGSNVRMTYFATAGMTSLFNLFDEWAGAGNEIANHSVTHNQGFGVPSGQREAGAHSTSRWVNEMVGLYSILDHWTFVTQHQSVTGFRLPNLFPTAQDADAYAMWVIAYRGYVDWLTTEAPKPNSFSDATIFYYSNSASGNVIPSLETKIARDLANFPDQKNVYFMEIPLFGENLMELPQCPANNPSCNPASIPQIKTDCNPGCLDWGTLDSAIETGATTIALHPQEISKHPDFYKWIDAKLKDGYSFVTVAEVVNWTANKAPPAPRSYNPADQNGPKVVSRCNFRNTPNYSKTPQNVGDPKWVTVASECDYKITPTDPLGYDSCSVRSNSDLVCNLDCNYVGEDKGMVNPDYGKNCSASWQSPDSTGLFFKTYRDCGAPNNKPVDVVWLPGSFPWIGNPSGNSTIGDTCNTFPRQAFQGVQPSDSTCATSPATWRSAGISWQKGLSWKSGDVAVCDEASGCATKSTNPYCCLKGEEAFCSSTDPANASASIYWAKKPPADEE